MATASNTVQNEVAMPKIVSRDQWLAERKELLAHEKDLTKHYDRVTAMPALRAQVASSGFNGDCWLLDESHLVSLR